MLNARTYVCLGAPEQTDFSRDEVGDTSEAWLHTLRLMQGIPDLRKRRTPHASLRHLRLMQVGLRLILARLTTHRSPIPSFVGLHTEYPLSMWTKSDFLGFQLLKIARKFIVRHDLRLPAHSTPSWIFYHKYCLIHLSMIRMIYPPNRGIPTGTITTKHNFRYRKGSVSSGSSGLARILGLEPQYQHDGQT